MKKCISFCAAALAAGIGYGATVDLAQTGDLALTALDNANTYVNAGAETRTLTVTCTANATNSCLITGNIRLVKAGTATLALSNGSNSFTGGADVQAGILEITAAGALGSGQIDVGSASATCQVRFSLPASSTIVNAIHVRASTSSYPAININGGGTSIETGLQFTGDITADGDLYIFDDASWVARKTGDSDGQYANTQAGKYTGIFRGAVTVNGDVFEVVPRCKLYFYGKVTAPLFRIGKVNELNTLARGFAYLVKENAVETFQCNYCSFLASTTNCFKDAVIDWSHTFAASAGETARGYYNMNGYDQRIAYFKGSKLPERARACYTIKNTNSAKVPTVTLSGSGVANDSISSDVWLYKESGGTFNLCLDAPDFTYALNGSFPTRPNTGVASLNVKRGTLRATGYASFPNATALSVGTNAVFSLESTTNQALSALLNLSVASGGVFRVDAACGADPFGMDIKMTLSLDSHATFELPAGQTAYVTELWIDGVRRNGGTYSGVASEGVRQLAQMSGEGVLVVSAYSATVSAHTWTGAGADDLSSTAANWDGSVLPPFDDGSLLATFATGGTRAEIDTTTSFNGIVFDLPADTPAFTLTRSSGTAEVKLGAIGVSTVAAADGSPRTAVVDTPLQISGNQVWDLGTATELVATQGITVLNMAKNSLYVQGATNGVSRLRLSAANEFTGLTTSNCHVSVDSSAGGVFGSTNVTTHLYAAKEFYGDASHALLSLGGTGAVFDGTMRFTSGVTPVYVLYAADNTTNALTRLELYSASAANRSFILHFGSGSRTVVNGPVQGWWAPSMLKGEGRVEFRQKVTTGSHFQIGTQTSDRLYAVFEAANNKSYTFVVHNNCTLDLRTDYAAMTDSEYPTKAFNIYGTVLLNGTTQYFWRLMNGGIIRGDAGSQAILGGVYTNNAAGVNAWFDNVNCATRFADAASVSLRSGRYNFTGVSETTGNLTMTNGWARFQTGSMTNAQTVTVAGTGILELKASERFGEESVWRVGGNGRVLLDEGVRQTCGQLFLTDIDGEKPRRPGLYGSPEAHAANAGVKADSHFEGRGVLYVKGLGTMIIFR